VISLNITRELAQSSIDGQKKNTFAIKMSILMAVILLGTVIFIVSDLRLDEIKYIKEQIGDYQVSISGISSKMRLFLEEHDQIEKINYEAIEKFNSVELSEKGIYLIREENEFWNGDSVKIVEGRKPKTEKEIIVSERLIKDNTGFSLNSQIEIENISYKIVGVYKIEELSFEDYVFYGILEDRNAIFEDDCGVNAYIWYKEPRDTFHLTRDILEKFDLNEKDYIETGKLGYNTGLLEHYFIFPNGLIPTKDFAYRIIEKVVILLFLTILFALMIYNAFVVWNNRDIRQIGLLKSVGMTKHQVRNLVINKALKLSVGPIISGTIISYIAANLLTGLMWLNNYFTYNSLNKNYGMDVQLYDFHLIKIQIMPIIILWLFSFLCVYLAALKPAKDTGKVSIIDALNQNRNRKIKLSGNFQTSLDIEKNLAKDYTKAYGKTYRGLTMAMAVAAFTLSVILIINSWRVIDNKYNSFHSTYSLNCTFWTSKPVENQLVDNLYGIENIDEIHFYSYQSAKFYMTDNKEKLSDEFKDAIDKGNRTFNNPYAMIYGLEDEDFEKLIKNENIEADKDGFILLDSTPENNINVPYVDRNYIPILKPDEDEINIQDNKYAPVEKIKIIGKIKKFPFDLDAYSSNGIAIFTSKSNFDKWISSTNVDIDILHHNVKLKTSRKDLGNVTNAFKDVLFSHISSTDVYFMNDFIEEGYDKEVKHNELFFSLGIQAIFLIIALSNAYNSFHGNLQARKNDFALLRSVGMTEDQIDKMLNYEGFLLVKRVIILYLIMLVGGIFARCIRKHWIFSPIQVFANLNYISIVIFFVISILGIYFAIRSGKKYILNQNINEMINELN
jgi:putative ABC transport system permease protein